MLLVTQVQDPVPDDVLQRRHATALGRQLVGAIVATLLAIGVLAATVWEDAPAPLLWGWVGLASLNQFYRLWLYLRFRASAQTAADVHAWQSGWPMRTFVTACLWGSTAVLFLHHASPQHQLILTLIVFGVVASAVPMVAADQVAIYGFTLPALLPYVLANLWLDGPTAGLLVGVELSVTVMLVVFARSHNVMLVQNREAGERSEAMTRLAQSSLANLQTRNEEIGRALAAAEDAERATARHAAALARSEATQRALLEASPDGILVVHGRTLVFVNRRCAGLLGHPDGVGLVGQPLERLILGQGTAVLAPLLDGARTPRPDMEAVGEHVRVPRQDGSLLDCEATVLLVEFDGSPATMVTLRDISHRLALQQRVTLHDRLVSVGTLAAGVAHEINNPLSAVLGNAALVREAVANLSPQPDPEQLHELAAMGQDIEEGAERVSRIVRDLQMFARARRDGRERLDPRKAMATALRLANAELSHRTRVVEEMGETPLVDAAEAALGQALVNILVNAARAIPEGDRDHHTVRVCTSTGPSGEALLDIQDDGVGINPEVLPRIFDPFFTTKAVGEGTGMGLSVSHSIITSLGGTIHVQSTLGQGTTVQVTLPAATGDAPQPEAGVSLTAGRSRGRVMVVDDDVSVGNLLVRALQGRPVVVASSAREALAHLAGGERFEVIFCDLMMPNMTGMDLYEELGRSNPQAQASMVFITAGTFTPRAEQFLQHTRVRTLYKPLVLEEIRALAAGLGRDAPG